MPTIDQQNDFLEKDLPDALKWLFVGAVVWQATHEKPECVCHQSALGMFMSLVQARALYEFYCTKGRELDDTRASEFCDSWTFPDTSLYRDCMKAGKPANKRVFHLVYGRSKEANAGGPGHSGPTHINRQVLNFARDLRQITATFANSVRPNFASLAQSALEKGLEEAHKIAILFGIANPL